MRPLEAAGRAAARGLLVLFGISVLVFLIFLATPGADPAARLAGRGASPERVAAVRAEYGLDRPLPAQYARLMWRLLGPQDLESTVNRGTRVVPEVLRAAPTTLALALGAALLFVPAGLLGAVLAVRAGPAAGRFLVAAGLLGASVPAFWLAGVVSWAAQGPLRDSLLAWVPPPGLPAAGWGEWLRGMALPCATLAVLYAGVYARLLRAELLTAERQDWVRTARAKGLRESRVLLLHVLPLAATPALALLGLDLGALVGGGTVLVEVVFGLPGLGRLTFDGLRTLDLPAVMACVLYASAAVVTVNVLAEVAGALLDPASRG